jgi:hypothetical protein
LPNNPQADCLAFIIKEKKTMCFSQYAQYAPRPVKHHDYDEYEYTTPVRPEGAPPTKAELDENLFGPKPMPPEWQQTANRLENDHGHDHAQAAVSGSIQAVAINSVNAGANGSEAISNITTQTIEAVVVELSNGTKLLICPL